MSAGKNILKMVAGIVIIAIGIVWYTGPQLSLGSIELFKWYGDLLILLKGTIGLFLLFVGLIIAWMGYDDYKMDKEMAEEEKEEPVETGKESNPD